MSIKQPMKKITVLILILGFSVGFSQETNEYRASTNGKDKPTVFGNPKKLVQEAKPYPHSEKPGFYGPRTLAEMPNVVDGPKRMDSSKHGVDGAERHIANK